MTLPDCWIRAKRLPSGPEQNCVNVRIGDENTGHTLVMDPEDILDLSDLISKFVWDDPNSSWRVRLSPEEFKKLCNSSNASMPLAG